jgi:hypothetical protein
LTQLNADFVANNLHTQPAQLLFGPAMPALYFLAAGGLCLRYLVEKWSDVQIFARPPLYNQNLVGSFDQVQQPAIAVAAAAVRRHLAMHPYRYEQWI